MSEIKVGPAESAEDLRAIADLFRDYAIDVPHIIGLDADLADLPGKYGPPGGLLLLARRGGRPIGCVAYRTIDPGSCELKRLFVRPDSRGAGLGRRLIAEAVAAARDRGFREMFLDTAPDLVSAHHLYQTAGFREVPPYWDNPVPGVIYFRLTLVPPDGPEDFQGEAGHGD